MKKLIIASCFVLLSLCVNAQAIYRISNNGGCVWVKNMTTGIGTCGKLEFSDKVSYVELRFGSEVVSADISELKDANGVSLGATNQDVINVLGIITQTSAGGGGGTTNGLTDPQLRASPLPISASDSTKYRKVVQLSNPYTVLASDSIKYRKLVQIANPYVVLASDSTKYRKTISVENPYVVNASDSIKYRKAVQVLNPYEVQASDSTKYRKVVQILGANFDVGGNLKVANTSANGIGTQANGSIAAGGTAQVALALNTNRVGFEIINTSSAILYINISGTATTSSLAINPGQSYSRWVGKVFTNDISIIGATTGQTFTTLEI